MACLQIEPVTLVCEFHEAELLSLIHASANVYKKTSFIKYKFKDVKQ